MTSENKICKKSLSLGRDFSQLSFWSGPRCRIFTFEIMRKIIIFADDGDKITMNISLVLVLTVMSTEVNAKCDWSNDPNPAAILMSGCSVSNYNFLQSFPNRCFSLDCFFRTHLLTCLKTTIFRFKQKIKMLQYLKFH